MKNVYPVMALAVTLALAGCGGGGSGGDNTSQRTVTPEVSLSGAPVRVKEDAGTHDIAVTLNSPAPAGGLTLNYTEDGTAKTVTVPAGHRTATITVTITDDSTAGEEDETRVITLAAGTGYTLGSAKTFTLTITDDDPAPSRGGGGGGSPSGGSGGEGNGDKDEENNNENNQQSGTNDLLGEKDQDELNKVVAAVMFEYGGSTIGKEGVITACGENDDCKDLVEKLEAQAKNYTPLSLEDLERETVGSGTFLMLYLDNGPGHWTFAVHAYRTYLEKEIKTREAGDPPHTPDTEAIASAVRAAVGSGSETGFFKFVPGRNAIASNISGPTDPWGVWIKQDDDSALFYWHREATDTEVRTAVPHDRADFFKKYASDGENATYDGPLDGYAHYIDGDGNKRAGTFSADVQLEADFGTGGTEAMITGTVSVFRGAGAGPGWQTVTLNSDYTAEGATTTPDGQTITGATADDASGHWSPDFVYDANPDDTRPDNISGRIGLTFTANSVTGAVAGAAAGVFDAPYQPPSP